MAKIDKYQRIAIEAVNNSVVSAGAGSGKTTVLSERFTDLVINRNCEVDQILTLTFTKKATVEMSSRIYKVLSERVPEKAKDFYKANIKTLDSYCNSVAKLGCNRYGISPDFVQDSDGITSKIEAMALPFILEHKDNEAIKLLVDTKNYATIANQLFVEPILSVSTVTNPIDFEGAIKFQQAEILEAWKKNSVRAEEITGNLTASIQNYLGNKTKFTDALLQIISNPSNDLPDCQLQLKDIENSNSSEIEEYTTIIKQIADVKLPGGKAGPEIVILKEYICALRECRDVLISICNYVSSFYITKEILPLFIEFQDKVNDLKRSSGLLTFNDISSLATCTLRDFPDLRQIEKEKYKAIMIDEFQDNNQQQRDMLFMIAEKLDRHEKGIPEVQDLCPDKLFFVGDEKQSIYRFRGADVSVFRALSQDFKDGNLNLSTNYRSHPSLIRAFNIMFGANPAVFFTEADEEEAKSENSQIPNYEAIYHQVSIPEDKAAEAAKEPNIAYAPHVHIARYNKNTVVEGNKIIEVEAEARWVAEKILELCTKGVNGKVYTPGQIAVLFRNYKLQPLYERTFLNYGIPYDSEVVTGVFSDGPVNDIFSFLRICLYENDTISYAQVLRSPFVNLTVAETNAVILTRELPFEGKAEEVLSGEGKEKYLHAKKLYEKLKETTKSVSITKLVSKLWYEAGYRYETMWNKKVGMYSKMYDLIFELARQAEESNVCLSAFLDGLRTYEDQSAKLDDMDIPMEKNQGVHILSIHKSKGLEYDVVFVCDTQKEGANNTNDKPIYTSKEFGITVNTPVCKSFSGTKSNYFYDKVNEARKKMETAELRRVTYVAATRAAYELYITNGSYSPAKDSSQYSPYSDKHIDSIYHILEPVISFYEDEAYTGYKFFDVEEIPAYDLDFNTNTTERKNKLEHKLQLLKALEEDGIYEKAEIIKKEAVANKYASPSQLHITDDENNYENFEISKNPEIPFSEINSIVYASIPKKDGKPVENGVPRFGFTNFGTIAHAYMEAVITGEPAKYSNRDIVGLENHEKDLKTIIEICTQMQEKFKQSDLGEAAMNSQWHKPEYEFRSLVGNKIIKGIIDLVFQNADGTYTIVDYKTNQYMEPELYYNQLACYRQAIAQMLNVSDASKINCWLYYLRYGKSVDITKECNQVNLEEVVANLDN